MENQENKILVPTLDHQRCYTLDAIQTLFLFCSDPVEKFAERYKLSPTLVEAYVREGRWNELRAAHTEAAYKVFQEAETRQTEDSIDLELKWQSIRNIQSELQLQEFSKYLEKYGDLWARNPENEEILRDAFGFPMPLRIPQTFKAAHELITSMQTRLAALVVEQKQLNEEAKQSNKGVIMADYKHLLQPKKKDSDGS